MTSSKLEKILLLIVVVGAGVEGGILWLSHHRHTQLFPPQVEVFDLYMLPRAPSAEVPEPKGLGSFEPYADKILSFTMTVGQGFSSLPDFGQTVISCRSQDMSSTGLLPWYGNFQDREQGVVIAELKIGGYFDPADSTNTYIVPGVNPGPFGDTFRRFDPQTGNVTESETVTEGWIRSARFNPSFGGLLFFDPVIVLSTGKKMFVEPSFGESGEVLKGGLSFEAWYVL